MPLEEGYACPLEHPLLRHNYFYSLEQGCTEGCNCDNVPGLLEAREKNGLGTGTLCNTSLVRCYAGSLQWASQL